MEKVSRKPALAGTQREVHMCSCEVKIMGLSLQIVSKT